MQTLTLSNRAHPDQEAPWPSGRKLRWLFEQSHRWDQISSPACGDCNDSVWCARLIADVARLNLMVSVRGLGPGPFNEVLSKNGDYTIFLTAAPCPEPYDLRELFSSPGTATGAFGRLASDPDVVELSDGTLRINTSADATCGASAAIGRGLVVCRWSPLALSTYEGDVPTQPSTGGLP